MELPLTRVELVTTTGIVRKRRDLDRAAPRADDERRLRLAVKAPDGSNQRHWDWVLVDDRETLEGIGDRYRASIDEQIRLSTESGDAPAYESTACFDEITEPVLYLTGADPGRSCARLYEQATRWGSVLPAVWSFMLVLRSHGFGSAWTTRTLHRGGATRRSCSGSRTTM
jgi:nitroreductase